MEIILVRHAIALDKNIAITKGIKDSKRKLTAAGKKKFKKHILNHISLFKNSDFILSSPYLRAKETADILVKQLPFIPQCVSSSVVVPDGSVDKFLSYLKNKTYRKFVVVSHEPFLSQLIKSLTAIPIDSIHLKKGSLAVLRLQPTGKYKLYQLLNP